ncbi:MAG: eCIS core domain-containing protein [Gammaproteobacteria bacterium]
MIESPESTGLRGVDHKSWPATAPSCHGHGGLHPVTRLQRKLGNRNVAKFVQAKRLTPEGQVMGLQCRLTVGAADDRYEQEADRVARQVMGMTDAETANSMRRNISPAEDGKDRALQTKPLAASMTPFVQRQPEAEEEDKEPIRAKPAGSLSGGFEAGEDVEIRLNQSKGHGSPLPDPVRTYMEPRFGVDFSGVRVHTGEDALKMNQAVGAQAFTHGADIYFGEGHSPTDLALTAHELAHVVQQTGKPPDNPGLSHSVQLKESKEDGAGNAPVPVDATVKTDSVPAEGGDPLSSTAVTPKKTVNMTLTAIYEDIPGEAKDRVKRAKDNEAVWLDPLTMLSNFPVEKRNTLSYGVVAGGGQKTVDTFKAPISESTQARGRGSVSASLKYAGDQNKSFDVTVTGIKKNVRGAEAMARKVVEREIQSFGDIDEITAIAERELGAVEKYQGAKVAISVRDSKVMDAGRTTFYYKVRSDCGIQMELQVAPIGEKQTKYRGSKTTGTSTEDESSTKTQRSQEKEDIAKKETDSYNKQETATETQDVDYHESVVKTLDDYVSKATTVHNELASDLSEKVIKHHEAKWGDKEESHRTAKNYTDYTKDSKHSVESGERDKENWAAKLKKGVQIARKVTSIPYVDKVPGLGWLSRRIKGWQLDLAEAALGVFEEKGKVGFTDTKLDEQVESKQDIKDDTERERNVELKVDDKTEVKRKLIEDFKSKTQEDWERHLKDISETSKIYRSKIKKDSKTTVDRERAEDYRRDNQKEQTENERRHKNLENQTTTATFEVATTWKFTKPVVKASVTSGDAEVSYSPFPPEAEEVSTVKK